MNENALCDWITNQYIGYKEALRHYINDTERNEIDFLQYLNNEFELRLSDQKLEETASVWKTRAFATCTYDARFIQLSFQAIHATDAEYRAAKNAPEWPDIPRL